MHTDDLDDSVEPARSACAYAWCTTEHGATIHPDDEVHRSAGVAVAMEYRHGAAPSEPRSTTIEIGLVRRRSDREIWLAIDDGQTVDAEIPARLVHDAVLTLVALDHDVAAELGLRG